jgi:hypothetical protein
MKQLFFLLLFPVFSFSIMGQHEHHQRRDTVPVKKVDSSIKNHSPKKMDHGMHLMASHAFSRNLPMSRNASGTSWNPDATPMYMAVKQGKKTDWMFHGNIYLRYTNHDIFSEGSRGDEIIDAPNWLMLMMNRKTGKKGLLNATLMLSFDPLTEGGDGYPLLYQSGETYKGQPLVDRQHPHDLFSALSIGYTYMINKEMDVFGYIGYPGEPALGAPAFMHRISSVNNPDAPLGHHWQDATHITFGVATLGFRYNIFKFEGSSFTGREPDENRYGFDDPKFDSYSYRISFNPAANWAMQFSQGFIKSPEALEPDVDVIRTTASVLYARHLNSTNHLTVAAIWGLNDKENHSENSFLLEGNLQFNRNAVYSRYEFVQKSKHELNLDDNYPDKNFNVNAITFGYNRRLTRWKPVELLAGAQSTIYKSPMELQELYGKWPVALEVYFQLRPSLHKH